MDLKSIIYDYKKRVERMERLLKPYYEKKKTDEGLAVNEHAAMLILEAERRQLLEVIADLEDIA